MRVTVGGLVIYFHLQTGKVRVLEVQEIMDDKRIKVNNKYFDHKTGEQLGKQPGDFIATYDKKVWDILRKLEIKGLKYRMKYLDK